MSFLIDLCCFFQGQYRFVCECICAAYSQLMEQEEEDGSEHQRGNEGDSDSQTEEAGECAAEEEKKPISGDHSDNSSISSSAVLQPVSTQQTHIIMN